MKILDTNLWVFGTLRTNERATELLTAIDRGETTSAISAYMLQEALAAFDRTKSLSATERDTVKTNFVTRPTNDESFAEFEPAAHSLSEITIIHTP